MKSKWTIGIISIIILACASIFLLGFKLTSNKEPKVVYNVYLEGNKIGVVNSKDSFEEYINKQEETLKQKYNVSKIYTPKGVEIKKAITYDDKCDSDEKIYNLLVKEQNFTLKGIVIEIEKENSKEVDDEKKAKKEKVVINVTSKDIFDEAIVNIIKAFIDEKEYNAFMEGTQDPIVDTGSLVESIYLKEKVTYKESYISTDEEIFTDVGELTKYLLYGTTKKQDTYIVKDGDTIETIANKNKLNTKEFLIANPEFTSVNNLLYASQEVNVGLINPVISVVVEKHAVSEEVSKYTTDIKYDSELVIGYSYVEREGENGLDKVTRKYQYINGQVADVALVNSVEIKPSVSQILVKGEKYIPNVADLSYWAWPTQTPYTITTWFEYRWGSFHNAIDIYVGWGSPVYAGNNGTVVSAVGGCVRGDTRCNGGRGNYIVINHNISGYHTEYMHLNSINVRAGQTVSRGQYIASMGNTGYVVPTPPYGSSSYAGTHLHYGLWIGHPDRGGTAINPMSVY